MVGFIDLILSNPLLLFFAIAMLFNLFGSSGNKKENEKGNKQATKTSTREARKSNKSEEIDWRDIFSPESFPFFEEEKPSKPTVARRTELGNPTPVKVEAMRVQSDQDLNQGNSALQAQYEQLKMKQEQVSHQLRTIGDSPIYGGEISSDSNSKLNLNFNHVSQNEIVKGIIWSEILNKPKSKSS